jgi:uncharacterized CHY-type Zn-finger protein
VRAAPEVFWTLLIEPHPSHLLLSHHDPMSLFSSFIIDPVVRHARRFSGVSPVEASHDGTQPLACDSDSVDDTNTAIPHGDIAQATATQPTALIDRFRRYSSFSQRPRSAVVDEGEEERNDVVLNTPVDMSANPSRLADQFRHLDVDPTRLTAPPTTIQRTPSTASQHAGAMAELLPADDGMAHLRMRIHEIRDLNISDQERARMVHSLMTERYNIMRPTSPASFISHDRPFTPTSGQSVFSEPHASSPYSSASDVDPENPYNLREGDTNPTYRPAHQHHGADHGDDDEEDVAEGELALGCQHYKRNVKVQCYECRRWYTCRHCHDAVEDHNLNRTRTQNMLCMACGTPQKAADHCKKCELESACYYCDLCKLWDNNSKKKIYHCPDCGICRRGEGLGKDFYHCKVSRPFRTGEPALTMLGLQCLHFDIPRYIAQMPSTCHRGRLSYLRRPPVHVFHRRSLHALWALSAQGMLQPLHADRIQMPDM